MVKITQRSSFRKDGARGVRDRTTKSDEHAGAGTGPVPSLSPSLHHDLGSRGKSPPAYEFKYLLDANSAEAAEARVSAFLEPDPHADPALGGAYAITSVYCDTPEWSAYFREDSQKGRKYRVRRYGESPVVYLERKTVRSRQVRKRRESVPISDLALLPGEGMGWRGAWYARQISRHELSPV